MAPRRGQRDIFLRASRDIETIKRHGQRLSTRLFNLLVYRRSDDAPSRVGIIVGRRFGNAVRRNRAKRVFRELTRRRYPEFLPGQALLIFPKRDALLQPAEELRQLWDATLRRVQVLKARSQ